MGATRTTCIARSLAAAIVFSLLVAGSAQARASQPVTVMSYNIFQGSELSHTLSAKSLAALPAAVAADYANVIASNIPARAAALAAEIKASKPDLVGLQEAALWRTQSPPAGIKIPGTATAVGFDTVALLVKALNRLGLHYRAVAITNNVDVQATAGFPNGRKFDVRFTDRVAILARQGVAISNVQDHNFAAHDAFKLLGAVALKVPDGWASVDARVGGRKLRFITSHLDGLNDSSASSIRAAEAHEIAAGPDHTSLPVVFTCDCNAKSATTTHHNLTAVGLRDSWAQVHPHAAGLTCCHRSSPTNPEVSLTDPIPGQGIIQRIDYIFSSSRFKVLAEKTVGLSKADRTKTSPKLWPSDHLGLVAMLALS
jgi:endonuclease/exonuclease/phosphatase family metal-dependent hydrolase